MWSLSCGRCRMPRSRRPRANTPTPVKLTRILFCVYWVFDMATLHPTRRVLALMPLYVQRFACTGAQCEDTCCSGWTVLIDKKTYQSYRQTKNPPLAGRLDARVKRMRSQASDANYARIELRPDTGECPMLEERLCSVQNALGEDKLSNVCFTYPRKVQQAGDVCQQVLTLSCPEAARLALLADDAFEFVESAIAVRPAVVEQVQPKWGLSLDQMNGVRFFCLQIVRGEGLQLWQKLAMLGLFCETLTQVLQAGEQDRLAEIMQTTRALITSGQAAEMLASVAPQHDMQALTFHLLWRFSKTIHMRPTHRMVFDAMADGLGADPKTGEVAEELLIARYQQGLGLLPTALQDAPAFMENLVLNDMLREMFPFGTDKSNNPQEQFLRLATRFGLVRFMLAVQCRADAPLPGVPALVRTVQVFARRFQHDSGFAAQVDTCLKNLGWGPLDRIFRLLKS